MRYIVIVFCCAFGQLGLCAQNVEIRDVFKQMPDTICRYLSTNNKLDMIDFLDSNMEAKVSNSFNGTTTLDVMTNDYLKVTLTPASLLEMRLLPYKPAGATVDGQIICMVTTYGDSIKESVVNFYTTGWKEIKRIKNPLSRDIIKQIVSSDSILSSIGMGVADFCAEARLSSVDNTMKVSFALPQYIEGDKIVTKHMDVLKTLKWDGVSFK